MSLHIKIRFDESMPKYPIEIQLSEVDPDTGEPINSSVCFESGGPTSFTVDEALALAVAIFEKVIPILHKEELDKIPF
jgi:hypothetical protein